MDGDGSNSVWVWREMMKKKKKKKVRERKREREGCIVEEDVDANDTRLMKTLLGNDDRSNSERHDGG